jgi:trimeric autotransporter adhesin
MTDANGYKSVDYGRLTPVLVEAIKEQQKQINAQQLQIDELKKDRLNMQEQIAQLKKLMETFVPK